MPENPHSASTTPLNNVVFSLSYHHGEKHWLIVHSDSQSLSNAVAMVFLTTQLLKVKGK